METTLDQTLFTNNLRCIAHPQLSGAEPEDEYMSLLGAIAYFAHALPDIVVFICALLRHTQTTGPARARAQQATYLDSEKPSKAG
eukprot:2015854-Lingulodinium_polyedra.AAC.1